MKWRLLFLALLFSGVMMAQVNGDRQNRKELKQNRQERIENLKIAYITKELNLTTAESQEFWPVYNKYQQMLKETRQNSRVNKRDGDITESDANLIIQTYVDNEFKRAEINEKMINELKPIIGSVRVIHLFKVETKFKKEILNRNEQRNRNNQRERKR